MSQYINPLEAMGGFVSDKPVLKKVTWVNEEGDELSADVFVVHMPIGEVRAMSEETDKSDRDIVLSSISRAIRFADAEGSPTVRLTYEQAAKLKPSLAYALLTVVTEVNNPPQKKTTMTKTSSASSSSTELAEEPSEKPASA